jgi:hypothetical protein
MAHKEHLKKAVALPGGGFEWSWDGVNGVRHTVTWQKNGVTEWTVWLSQTPIHTHQPWFLVRARGEVQENVKYFKDAGLDLVLANRALLAVGMMPDQHQDQSYCNCGQCVPVLEDGAASC